MEVQIDLQFVQMLTSATARRGGESLRRRRVWSSDAPTAAPSPAADAAPTGDPAGANGQTPSAGTTAESQNTEKPAPGPVPYDRFQEVVKAKNEAQLELDRLKAESDKRAKEDEARKQKEAEERGQFKELYDSEKAKVESLQAQINELLAYRAQFEETLKAQIAALPAHIVPLLEKMTPIEKAAYLKEHGDSLTTRRAPNLDAGERHTGSSRTNVRPNPIGRM